MYASLYPLVFIQSYKTNSYQQIVSRSDGCHFWAELAISKCVSSIPCLTNCHLKLKDSETQGNGRVTKWKKLGFLGYHMEVCPWKNLP